MPRNRPDKRPKDEFGRPKVRDARGVKRLGVWGECVKDQRDATRYSNNKKKANRGDAFLMKDCDRNCDDSDNLNIDDDIFIAQSAPIDDMATNKATNICDKSADPGQDKNVLDKNLDTNKKDVN